MHVITATADRQAKGGERLGTALFCVARTAQAMPKGAIEGAMAFSSPLPWRPFAGAVRASPAPVGTKLDNRH